LREDDEKLAATSTLGTAGVNQISRLTKQCQGPLETHEIQFSSSCDLVFKIMQQMSYYKQFLQKNNKKAEKNF